jgi:hypothetical protein
VGSIRHLIFEERGAGKLPAPRLENPANRKRCAIDILLLSLPANVKYDNCESRIDQKARRREET